MLTSKLEPPLVIIALKYLVYVDSSVVHLSTVVDKASRDIAVFMDLEINISINIWVYKLEYFHFSNNLTRMKLCICFQLLF